MTSTTTRRAEALRRYGILDTTAEKSFDAIARLASEICGTACSAVSFFDGSRQWLKSAIGLRAGVTDLCDSFCRYTAEQEGPMVVPDVALDARFTHNNFDTGGARLRFYAGCALRSGDGTAIGAICVLDPVARPRGLNSVELSALEVLARQVEAHLELRLSRQEHETELAASRLLTQKLLHQESHDALTGLPNRTLFWLHLQECLERCDAGSGSLSLIIVNVDHFQQTNDAFGHDAGDALLKKFAARLQSVVGVEHMVARTGGDEFAIILGGVGPAGPGPTAVGTLLERLRQPIEHQGRSLECRASIGISTYPKDANSAEHLHRSSDLALAKAKISTGASASFDPSLLERFDTKRRTVSEVRERFVSDTFDPFYQPKIDLSTGQRVGFEALMRWRHTDRPEVSNLFGSGFPDQALVARIGLRMIEKILDDIQLWTGGDIHIGKIAINTSAIDFSGDNFSENLLAHLRSRNIPANQIEIEVTESVFLGRGVPHIARALRVLREAGVSVALDDFGTGFASLTHLRQFPVDVIKIDRSFIDGITRRVEDAAIVRAVIGLSKNLGIVTVAEGIETSAQEAFVRHHGCDIGQGYLYGPAVPASEVKNEQGLQEAVA